MSLSGITSYALTPGCYPNCPEGFLLPESTCPDIEERGLLGYSIPKEYTENPWNEKQGLLKSLWSWFDGIFSPFKTTYNEKMTSQFHKRIAELEGDREALIWPCKAHEIDELACSDLNGKLVVIDQSGKNHSLPYRIQLIVSSNFLRDQNNPCWKFGYCSFAHVNFLCKKLRGIFEEHFLLPLQEPQQFVYTPNTTEGCCSNFRTGYSVATVRAKVYSPTPFYAFDAFVKGSTVKGLSYRGSSEEFIEEAFAEFFKEVEKVANRTTLTIFKNNFLKEYQEYTLLDNELTLSLIVATACAYLYLRHLDNAPI